MVAGVRERMCRLSQKTVPSTSAGGSSPLRSVTHSTGSLRAFSSAVRITLRTTMFGLS